MLEHARQTIPGVRSLRADYESGYGIDIPCVLIKATVSDFDAVQEADNAWGVWRLTAFPPQLGEHLVLFTLPEDTNAG